MYHSYNSANILPTTVGGFLYFYAELGSQVMIVAHVKQSKGSMYVV